MEGDVPTHVHHTGLEVEQVLGVDQKEQHVHGYDTRDEERLVMHEHELLGSKDLEVARQDETGLDHGRDLARGLLDDA